MGAQATIPGIYNYCDRWCERCAFTERCTVFIRSSQVPEDDSDDLESALRFVQEQLQEAVAEISELQREQGIEITDEDLETAAVDFEQQRQKSREHPLVQLGTAYAVTAGKLLHQPRLTEQFTEQLQQQAELGIVSEEQIRAKAQRLQEQLDVISYYRLFLPPKIYRAVSGALFATAAERADLQSDYRGSAKVAAICIQNSTAAYQQLLQLLPEAEDTLLDLLAQLQQMERLLLEAIPDCMQFLRPGFDGLTD